MAIEAVWGWMKQNAVMPQHLSILKDEFCQDCFNFSCVWLFFSVNIQIFKSNNTSALYGMFGVYSSVKDDSVLFVWAGEASVFL